MADQGDPSEQDRADLISLLFDLPASTPLGAVQEIARTRVHPAHYRAVSYINDILKQRGPCFVRSVSEWVEQDSLRDLYPIEASNLHPLDRYRAAVGVPEDLADLYRELSVFAALANVDFLYKLFAAVVSVSTSETLQRRFHDSDTLTSNTFWNEVADMRRTAGSGEVLGQRAQWISDVQPLHAAVQETDSDGSEHLAYYRLPATVHVYDPMSHIYDIQFNEPRQVERYPIDHELSIPWVRAQTGFQLELAIAASSGHHLPERYFLTAAQLSALRDRGSAIHTRVGRWDEIRLYPEFIQPIPGEKTNIPDHSLVSLRVMPQSVHIQKLDPNLRLTVYV